ncbi:AAA family ATPase [Micromonospora sp. KC721]|uniref:ATP-binding protein n=1 Tax=Micromonospora sp. KC721 TaxID=2530380 RepID=UPI001043EBB7|nr:helix-turn-helix transcriptional regulator [Micromonospora sp. KC721]TDB81881.1 helix-turn-helix transcriptional regulator [Micromonospora sp. KC721]
MSPVLPLVGRAAQLEMLDSAVALVAGGRFAVVEVAGEPGIGKTRILAELGRRASESGLLVCAGGASEFEQEVPFGMYLETLNPLIAATEADTDEVRGVLSALHGDPAGTGKVQSVDRFRVFHGVRQLLNGARAAGVVLLLDDLHWADHASLELTEYLIRKPPQIPMLVAVAFRSAWPPVKLIDAIAYHGPAAIRISIPPLRSADLEALLPGVARRRRALILRASRGNPLYVQALSRLHDGALATVAGDPGLGVPDWADGSEHHILAGLGAEFTVLDPSVQRIAHAAAVIGDHATVELAAYVSQLATDTVVDGVDQMHRLGLVEVDGVQFRFRHPLMRAAAHALAGPAWRTAAHARAATYLRGRDCPLQILVHHTERSAQSGDEAAAEILIKGGQAFAYSTPAQAARWFGTALRILPEQGALRQERPLILLQYARALGLSGNLEKCREILAELRHCGEPVRSRAAAFGAVVARLRGDLDEAAALVDAQLRGGRLRPAAEAKLWVERAAICALREDTVGAISHAERALALLDANHSNMAAAAQALRAFGALYGGDTTAARRYVAAATRLVDTVPDTAVQPHVELFGPLAWVEMHLGNLPSAARHLTRAKCVVDGIGQSSALPYLLVVETALQTRLGDLALAVQLAEEAAATARRVHSAEMRAMAYAVLLRPLLWTAGPAAAIAVGARFSEGDRPRSRTWWRTAQVNLALAHAVAGDAGTCLDLLDAPEDSWPAGAPIAVLRQVLRTVALCSSGDVARARAAAERATEIAAEVCLAPEQGLAGYARAYAAARARRFEEADALAVQAAAEFAAVAAPLEEALAYHLAGNVRARAGQPQRARVAFGRARAGYQACGATWLLSVLDRDEREGARAAGRLDRRAGGDAHTLTTREREIADLVAGGFSNQEVAERLNLSRRTVESHLSRIFTKLEVRSRTAMANRLHALGSHPVVESP